eukprot:gene13097-27649_t
MGEKKPNCEVEQRHETDCMESDYNSESKKKIGSPDDSNTAIKSVKLKTRGGARADVVGVDCYSLYVTGKLLKTLANPEGFVCKLIQRAEQDGYRVQVLSTVSGVAEPYNHALGTGSVEVAIKLIKELIRLAVTLILRNPNVSVTGFKDLDIYKLWGKFFL